MKKYCTQCGKKLNENGVCEGCKKETKVKLDFKNPIQSIKEAKVDTGISALLIIVTSIVIALFGCFLIKSFYQPNLWGHHVQIDMMRPFLQMTVLSIVAFYLFSAILYLLGKEVWKGNTNFQEINRVVALTAPVLLVTMLLGILFVNVPYLFSILLFLGGITFLMLLYHVLLEMHVIETEKMPYYMLLALTIFLFLSGILFVIL